jgi:starch phosphorylase
MQRSPHVAYFCMEFGLHESFPIYSGGLGILAGDFIKSARDLELPVVAVGLRWDRGYCVQRIGEDGEPFQEFPGYDSSFLRDTRVRVRVRVRGKEIPCVVWVTDHFWNAPLYLIEPLKGEDRWITHRLYEAGSDVRIAQEMLLGIGGLRALNWLGIPISTYHFNEGHAVFAGVEMIAERMETGRSFEEAWEDVRRHIVFTTHTPVKAGNEEHPLKDLRRMGACLQLSGAEVRAIGGDPFNMTVAGLRLARAANAVSKLHGRTANAMWGHIENAAPIGSVTNGVHPPTWQAEAIRAAARDPAALWEAHRQSREALRLEVERSSGVHLDPDTMWVGFARRAAPYKRGDLILRDEARLERLLEAGMSIVFSGKSHPDDPHGRGIIARLARAPAEFPGRVAFLQNYDMGVARTMVRGCDVWLNNPLLPLEACGTSGMKAALNGVLNLSILDGWWPEGCEHGVNGWAIGDGTPGDDERDLTALYGTLEREVLPAWRDRERWTRMMAASVEMAETRFSSHRMVREYFETMYAAAASAAGAAPVAARAGSEAAPGG